MLALAGVSGALAVCLGAFGAHALKQVVSPEMIAVYQTGVQYHFYHTFALALSGILIQAGGSQVVAKWAGWLFMVGIVLFSGSLYLLALGMPRWVGMITPLGGMCFIVGWLLIVVASLKKEIE